MTMAIWLLVAHAAATVFALGGLLIAVPHPELWASSPLATAVFSFGMRYGGALHIWLGAGAVLAFAVPALGWRRAVVFLVVSVSVSLASELLGTRTGLPFGAYQYTDALGPKILDRVPIAIPLSWFSVGLSAYVLALRLVPASAPPRHAVLLGALLLLAWDLVLDPAMAHEALPVRFWIWHRAGPYFGMPLQNIAGWALTGAAFMAISRALWRGEPDAARIPTWFPFAVYAINMAFAIALSLSVGLWIPVLLALGLGVAPAVYALRAAPVPARPRQAGPRRRITPAVRHSDAR